MKLYKNPLEIANEHILNLASDSNLPQINIDDVWKWCHIDERNIKWEDVIQILPPGWTTLSNNVILEPFELIRDKFDGWIITRVCIKRGLLHVYIDHPHEHIQRIMRRTSSIMSWLSVEYCIVCGQHGKRRRDCDGRPNLCSIHYLQYINLKENYGK